MRNNIFNETKNNKKKNRSKDLIFSVIFLSSLTITSFLHKYPGLIPREMHLDELTIDDVENKIMLSTNLSEEEKEYLCNEEYLQDILPYINQTISSRIFFNNHLDNIDIESYDEMNPHYKEASGYYYRCYPQIIYVRDYDKNEMNYYKDTISHEFVHMSQMSFNINIIKEACAEIISQEYFDNSFINSYYQEVIIVKTLMEIIGPEPVWNYNFTGDFSMIEENVKPYLSQDDYETFKQITMFCDDDKKRMYIDMEITNTLDKLYKAKYDDDIQNNEIINCIRNDKNIHRYYFNKRHINNEESYYINRELITINTKEAYKKGLIDFFISYNNIITEPRAVDFLNNPSFNGYVSGYNKKEGFKKIGINDLIFHKEDYSFYLVQGNIKVDFDKFYENNHDLDPNSMYKYTSKDGYIKSIDLDGDTKMFVYIKKSIPTIEESFDTKDKKLLKK